MTFNPNAEIRSGNVRRGGGGGGMLPGGRRGGGIAIGGGSGCLLLVVILIYALMGGNPMDILGGGQGAPQQPTSQQQGEVLVECQTGEDANNRDDCLVQAAVESADSLWEQAAPDAGIRYREPQGIIFENQVNTGCGPATSDVGPFYCPADDTIYVDVTFFQQLSDRYGADGGQLAKSYVVAHEYGHHIQNLDGTLTSVNRDDTGPQGEMVRLELQADCYAGLWAHHAATTADEDGVAMMEPLTKEDIDSALSAAAAVGDDHIQGELAGGQVTPETWTHGSSEQRQAWFTRGYEEGTVAACDTFSADRV